MDWTLADYAVAGALLAGAAGAGWIGLRAGRGPAFRLGAGLGAATGLALVFVSGAVGLVGAAANDANALFLILVLAVAAGAWLTRSRPGGLARVFAGAAGAQALVGAGALALGVGREGALWPLDVIAASAVFALLWLAAAALVARDAATRAA